MGVSHVQAKLEFETKEINTSATAYDKEVRVRYHFVNTGDKPVTITWLKSSCGCVVPKVRDQVVAPGQTGELEALFDIDVRQGKQKRTIIVNTDNLDEPRIELFFNTDIPLVIKPSQNIISWPEGESGTQKITVETDEKVPVQELVALYKNEYLDVKVEPAGPSKTYTVEFTPKPYAPRIKAKVNLQAKIGNTLFKIAHLIVTYK